MAKRVLAIYNQFDDVNGSKYTTEYMVYIPRAVQVNEQIVNSIYSQIDNMHGKQLQGYQLEKEHQNNDIESAVIAGKLQQFMYFAMTAKTYRKGVKDATTRKHDYANYMQYGYFEYRDGKIIPLKNQIGTNVFNNV